jgi:hypothetical protein
MWPCESQSKCVGSEGGSHSCCVVVVCHFHVRAAEMSLTDHLALLAMPRTPSAREKLLVKITVCWSSSCCPIRKVFLPFLFQLLLHFPFSSVRRPSDRSWKRISFCFPHTCKRSICNCEPKEGCGRLITRVRLRGAVLFSVFHRNLRAGVIGIVNGFMCSRPIHVFFLLFFPSHFHS